MKLLPRNTKEMFNTVRALKEPGQLAYLVGYPEPDTIRIRKPGALDRYGNELTSPKQLERKEYYIKA